MLKTLLEAALESKTNKRIPRHYLKQRLGPANNKKKQNKICAKALEDLAFCVDINLSRFLKCYLGQFVQNVLFRAISLKMVHPIFLGGRDRKNGYDLSKFSTSNLLIFLFTSYYIEDYVTCNSRRVRNLSPYLWRRSYQMQFSESKKT